MPRRPWPAIPREESAERRHRAAKLVKTKQMTWAPAVVNACVCLTFAAACARTPAAPTPSGLTGPITRVLMLTATAGFRHDSIPAAREALTSLGPANGFTITATEDLSAF